LEHGTDASSDTDTSEYIRKRRSGRTMQPGPSNSSMFWTPFRQQTNKYLSARPRNRRYAHVFEDRHLISSRNNSPPSSRCSNCQPLDPTQSQLNPENKSICPLQVHHFNFLWGRDSSVGIALGYRLDDRGVRVPAEAGNFSFHHRVQTGSGAHPA
jgi:hypothetical protein